MTLFWHEIKVVKKVQGTRYKAQGTRYMGQELSAGCLYL